MRGARCGVEHAVHQRLQPVGFLDDDLGVFAQLRASSSRSSSCAEPRMPPSGFLISCARLRISSRFACCSITMRSSRARRSCCSIGRSSASSASREPSMRVTMQESGSGSRPGAHVGHVLRSVVPVRARAPRAASARSSSRSAKSCEEGLADAGSSRRWRAGSRPPGWRSARRSSSSSATTAVASSSRPANEDRSAQRFMVRRARA